MGNETRPSKRHRVGGMESSKFSDTGHGAIGFGISPPGFQSYSGLLFPPYTSITPLGSYSVSLHNLFSGFIGD